MYRSCHTFTLSFTTNFLEWMSLKARGFYASQSPSWTWRSMFCTTGRRGREGNTEYTSMQHGWCMTFWESRKRVFQCFVSRNSPLLPPAKLGVYGRKYKVEGRWLEAVRKGSIRESLHWQLQFFSNRAAPHCLPFVIWKHWTIVIVSKARKPFNLFFTALPHINYWYWEQAQMISSVNRIT